MKIILDGSDIIKAIQDFCWRRGFQPRDARHIKVTLKADTPDNKGVFTAEITYSVDSREGKQ